MARLFITGICGFIGRNLAERAMELGYEVSGADIKMTKVSGAGIVKADIRDRKAMLRLTRNADYIVHLAAVTSNLEFEKRMPYAYDVNVNGFNSVIEAAYRNGCRRLLYASSSAVYKDRFSENMVIDISQMDNHYAKTKLINEAVGESYRLNGLLDSVGLRFFNVYGPGENDKGNYASIINIFRKMKATGKPVAIYGNGRQARDLVYVGDVANITLKLMKSNASGIYNLGTGRATSYNEIADMIGGRKVYVKNPLSTYQQLTRADTRKLLKAIGRYRFKSIKEGMAWLDGRGGV